jgi:hypothetical protein
MAEPLPVLAGACAVPSQPLVSTLTRYGQRKKHAPRNHEQVREFCQFLAHEWGGNRQHSYAVPSRGKLQAWSRTVDGKWSAVGLADAASKYAWHGKNFTENKAEFDRLAADLQSAIQRNSKSDVCIILRTIMHWGGADNSYRQKGTFEWIERNADEISAKLSNAVDLIKDERASLDCFDGVNLTMNSTMAKIVSLADPEQQLVAYDGRLGGALGTSLPDLRKNEKFTNTTLPISCFSPWTEMPNGPPTQIAFVFRHYSAKPETFAMPRWCDGRRN